MVGFFKTLYKENNPCGPKLGGLSFNNMSVEQATSLVRNFDESNVLATLNSPTNDKTPGPDGFPVCLYKNCWDPKIRYLKVVLERQQRGFVNWGLNNSFLILISKKKAITQSLIFAKLLANRLSGVLDGNYIRISISWGLWQMNCWIVD